MASHSPVVDPHHFNDYGFDPHFDYFQVLEEAKNHNKDPSRFNNSIDALNFNLQKPTSMMDSKLKKRHWWYWKNALFFFKSKWARSNPLGLQVQSRPKSGPIYMTESTGSSGSSTPYRTASCPSSGAMTPTRKGEGGIPYVCLRDLNVDLHPQSGSASAFPVYFVT